MYQFKLTLLRQSLSDTIRCQLNVSTRKQNGKQITVTEKKNIWAQRKNSFAVVPSEKLNHCPAMTVGLNHVGTSSEKAMNWAVAWLSIPKLHLCSFWSWLCLVQTMSSPTAPDEPEGHMHHVRYERVVRLPVPCQAKTDSSAHSAWWAPTARCPSASWPAPSSQHQTPACVGTKQLTLSLSLPSPLSCSVQSFTQTYVPYQPYTRAYLHKHMQRGTHF